MVLHTEEGKPDQPVLLVLGHIPLLRVQLIIGFVDGACSLRGEVAFLDKTIAIEEQDIDNVGKDIVVVLQGFFGYVFFGQGETSFREIFLQLF